MRRGLTLLGVAIALLALAIPAGAATPVTSRLQLRGHLPDLGERPAMRVFTTQAAYDSYRNSLGEANIFPAAGNMFMSFDRDILALYIRGNDSGGRCLQTGSAASLDGDTLTLDVRWQSGTCGAPISAHYPFIMVSLSRADSAGAQWIQPARSVCAAPVGVDPRACAQIGSGAAASPTPLPATPTAAPTAAPAASPTAQPPVAASPTAQPTAVPTVATPAATPTRTVSPTTPSPVAVASPPTAPADVEPNFLLYGAVVAAGLLVLLALILARPRRRTDQ